jgi:hypothetical protein
LLQRREQQVHIIGCNRIGTRSVSDRDGYNIGCDIVTCEFQRIMNGIVERFDTLISIGKRVVLQAKGFDMKLAAYDPYPDHAFATDHSVIASSLTLQGKT